MEIDFIIKSIIFSLVILTLYLVVRNKDIIKIILIYWKDLILRRK